MKSFALPKRHVKRWELARAATACASLVFTRLTIDGLTIVGDGAKATVMILAFGISGADRFLLRSILIFLNFSHVYPVKETLCKPSFSFLLALESV